MATKILDMKNTSGINLITGEVFYPRIANDMIISIDLCKEGAERMVIVTQPKTRYHELESSEVEGWVGHVITRK